MQNVNIANVSLRGLDLSAIEISVPRIMDFFSKVKYSRVLLFGHVYIFSKNKFLNLFLLNFDCSQFDF